MQSERSETTVISLNQEQTADAAMAHDMAMPGPTTSSLIQIPQLDLPARLGEDMPDRFMLLPASGVVPFHHERDALVDQRIDWVLAGEQPIKLCLVAGPGGSGKTRLLIEVCRKLKAEHGWQAGFLQPVDDVARELRSLLQQPQDCLIVIDYAETRAQDAVDLVRLALKVEHASRLRLVLLARRGGDWWNHLSEGAQNDVEAATILHGPSTRMGPYYLTDTDIALETRQQLFHEALDAFAAKIGVAAPDLPTPDLSAASFNQILFIHLAALAALRRATITDHKELLLFALSHERAYWRRLLERDGVDPHHLDSFEQLVALLTLIGGAQSAAETRDMVSQTPRLRDATPIVKNQMFDLLRPFTRPDGGANGLEPDLLGERLVADSLAKDAGLLDIVFKEPKRVSERIRSAYTVLTRLARQDPDEKNWLAIALNKYLSQTADDAMAVAMETGPPMEEMMREALQKSQRSGQQKIVNTLRLKLPEETSNLVDLAVDIAELYVSFVDAKGNKKNFRFKLNSKDAYDVLARRYESTGRFKEALDARQKAVEFALQLPKSGRDGNQNTRLLAYAYRRLADASSKMCRFNEALAASQQAEGIMRKLAVARPDMYRSDWARSLNNLGGHLRNFGRYEEALDAAQQAERLYRDLAEAQPEVYRDDWATSLLNLGNCLGDLRHYDETLAATQQAERLYRDLAEAQPEVYRDDWAGSLNNLSVRLRDLRCYDEALDAAQQAECIYRDLAEAQPEVYRHDWAMSLLSLGNCLGDLRRYDETLAATQQAERLYRDLAEAQPEVYRHDWAMSLNNLSVRLRDLRCYDEALDASQQAECIYRDLAEAQPEVYRHNWATSLHNLGIRLGERGRYDEALVATQQAERIRRELAEAQPEVYRDDWAMSLHNLCNHLGALGRYDEALVASQQAECIYRDLAEAQPEVYRHDWAGSLHNIGIRLGELGRYDEALAATQQAERHYRDLAEAQPEVYRDDWAMSLNNIGNCLGELGRYDEALVATQQAERIRRELAEAQPEVYRDNWAMSLHNLGIRLGELGRYDEALVATQQAERIRRELAEAQPEVYRDNWAMSLHNLGVRLGALGRYDEALQPLQQAEQILRELAETHPSVYRRMWAEALQDLSTHRSHLGQHEKALKQAQQAEHIMQELAASHPVAYRRERARALDNIGTVYAQAGEFNHAAPYHEQALTMYQEFGYRRGEGEASGHLGNIYASLGNLPEAIVYYHRALEIMRKPDGETNESAEAVIAPLLQQSKQWLPFLLDALRHEDPSIRLATARCFRYFPAPFVEQQDGVIDAVLTTLQDENDDVSEAAAQALEQWPEALTDEIRLVMRTVIREGYNPYKAGGPIHEDKLFFGRENILKAILNTVHNNSVLIYGERRIGKTSILFKLHRALAQLDHATCTFYPVFISLQGTPESKFFATLAHDILNAYDILNACPNSAELPLIYTPGISDYDTASFSWDMQYLTKHLTEVSSRPPKIVLLLDEIDTLNDYDLNTNLQLRNIFTGPLHAYFSAIMAGYELREDWPSTTSPPFNYLSQRLQIGPLDEPTARRLIEEPVRGIYRYAPEAMQQILDTSELKPFLIQKLCLEAVNHMSMQKRRQVLLEDVDIAAETVASMSQYLSPHAVDLSPEQHRLRDLEEENARLKARLAAMETRSDATQERT